MSLSPIEHMIDAATGHVPGAPQIRPAPPTPERLDEITVSLLAVADNAKAWWRQLRPVGWDKRRHIRNPAVNTTTPRDEALARAVAEWVRHGG